MLLRKVILIMVLLLLMPLSEMLHADNGGYIVKLKTENIPVELAGLLTEVNTEHGVYLADNPERLKDYSEYIEYTENNNEV